MVNFKVSSSIGAGATAQISIPSNEMAHKLLPRSVVHIFFFEDRYELGTKEVIYKDGTAGNTRSVDLEQRKADKEAGVASKLHDFNDIMNWKLLFTGELVGYGFSKIGGLRSINLICQDFTSYFNMAQMYWGPNADKMASKKKAIFLGATRIYSSGKKKTTGADKLTQILTAKPNGKVQPAGILGGIVSLLESATGVFSPGENGKKHRGVNDMMSYAELKYHLTRTIAASDRDQTASVFMNTNTFKKWLKRVGRSTQHTTSYLQLISAILPHIHYEWNSILAPPFVPKSNTLATYRTRTINVKYKGSGEIGEFIRRCLESEKNVRNFLGKTVWNAKLVKELAGGVDPVAYAPGYDPSTGEANRNTEVESELRKLTSGGNIGVWSAKTILNKGKTVRDSMYQKATVGDNASKIRTRADQLYLAYEDAAEAVNLIWYYKVAPKALRKEHLSQIQILLEKAARKAGGGLAKPTKTERGDNVMANSRLHMMMFRPDLYMCPPPKCNVLFPDMITSIFYSRNWMSEVTRLWLFTRKRSGRSRDDMYFSPNTTILGGGDKSSTMRAVTERISFHMDHEKFTGIVAAFEGVADWKQMKKAYKKQIKEGGEKDPNANGHLHRAANFLFFKKRYQGRVIRLNLRYSPQLVTGLPCLVLDPEDGTDRFMLVGSDKASPEKAEFEKHKSTGTHYLGVIHSLEHIADGSGGAETKVILTHCRTHTEASEIFGGRGKESNWVYTSFSTKKFVGKVKVEDMGKDAAGNEYYDEDARKALGNKFNPKKTYTFERIENAEGLPERTHFELGYESATGKSEFAITGGYSDVDTGESVTTHSAVPAVYMNVYTRQWNTSKKKVNFTFEAAVTPPWYSSIFLPNKIGAEFYDEMLGCKSVIDDPAILFPGTEESNEDQVKKDEQDAEAADLKSGDKEKEQIDMVEIYQKLPGYNQDTMQPETSKVLVPASLLKKTSSASYAADNLAETWLGLKKMRTDVNLFIDTYIDRSYATMLDIFGNTNKYAYTGVQNLGKLGRYTDSGGDEVEGFHGYAFGIYSELEGLDGADESLVADPKSKTKARPVKKEIDTRQAKFSAVKEYKRQLLASMKDTNVSEI